MQEDYNTPYPCGRCSHTLRSEDFRAAYAHEETSSGEFVTVTLRLRVPDRMDIHGVDVRSREGRAEVLLGDVDVAEGVDR